MSDSENEEYMYEYDDEDDDDMAYTDTADGDSGDDDEADRRTSSGSTTKDTKVPTDGTYRIMDMNGVQTFLNSQIDSIVDFMELDFESAFRLMQSFRYKKERMTDAFYNDRDDTLVKAGISVDPDIMPVDDFNSNGNSSSGNSKINTLPCSICYDDMDEASAIALNCNHSFCKTCYTQHLKTQVSEGVSCIHATCPQYKCAMAIPQDLFKQLLDKESYEKYNEYVLSNFVDCHASMRFCPAPDCGCVAIGTGVTKVECQCGVPFCFRCGEEVHDPADCDQVREWNVKCNNESETANWILANTKKCPKCNTRIEKNQGCNHMTCKVCRYDFCWTCMAPWSEHNSNTGGYYNCNRYKASVSDEPAEKAKAELDRYLFYYARYNTHHASLRFAAQQLHKTEEKMLRLQSNDNQDWQHVQFLKQAVKKVIDCRRTLKHTYVLGFFLKNETSSQKTIKNLFEHHQEMLEKNTETLSGETEKEEITEKGREDIINLTRVTDILHQKLIKCMMEGEEEMLRVQSQDDHDFGSSSSSSSSFASSSSSSSSSAAATATSIAASLNVSDARSSPKKKRKAVEKSKR